MSIRSFQDQRRLDQRITLSRKVETRDDFGDVITSWESIVDNVPAAVDAEKANSERGDVGGIKEFRQYTFWIRSDVYVRFGLRPVDRILWRGEPYDISAIPDQQLRGRFIAIIAATGVNLG